MGLFNRTRAGAPFMGEARQRTLHKNLDFAATEQYKLLRANLEFTVPVGTKCPVIGVTSSIRGEGKSTTAINLSYVIAEKGSRVLLIDGDLRIPSVAKKMNLMQSPGLTDVLMEKNDGFEKYRSDLLDTWYILPSGNIPPNPSELLGSKRMESALEALRESFDYIIIDLPPVNIVSDALSVANFITGMIVVVRDQYTEKKEFERCFRQLKLSNVNILGCVMNGTKLGGGAFEKYKRYYRKKDYRAYAEEENKD